MNGLSILTIILVVTSTATAFQPSHNKPAFGVTSRQWSSSSKLYAKGFGSTPSGGQKKQKSEKQVEREEAASRYDDIAGAGGQEYNVFVRQFGSDDSSWLPCGSIAVPRSEQVSNAIYSNEEPLKSGIVRQYPKLRGSESEFEFGYNLKVYPDDPVEVAQKTGPRPTGMSVGNWINTLLSPIDASKGGK